jgi:hypothetical protein
MPHVMGEAGNIVAILWAPSIINLPAPGCWTLHLSWSGHTDQLKLRYVA